MIIAISFCVALIDIALSWNSYKLKRDKPSIKLVEEYTLRSSPNQILDFNPHLTLSSAQENALFYDNPAICSSLSRIGTDGTFLSTSDDGPDEDCNNIDDGLWKAMPLFSAFVTKFDLDPNPWLNSDGILIGDIIINDSYIYLSKPGQRILSLQPEKQYTSFYENIDSLDTFNCELSSKLDLDFIFQIEPGSARNDAIDMEDIVFIEKKNKYIGCEEYGPSLVSFNDAFQVKMRYFPIGHSERYQTSYPKKEIFPKVIGDRFRERRGFESIAMDKKQETLILVMQSPLDLGGPINQNAPFLRVYVVDIKNIDINDIEVIGLYLYPLQNLNLWREITGNDNYNYRDTLVSATDKMPGDNDKYFVLEHGDGGILGSIVDFQYATNCIDLYEAQTSNVDDMLESMTIQQIKNDLHVTFLSLKLIIDYRIDDGLHSGKIEGAQWIDKNTLAICDDADFDKETKIQILHYSPCKSHQTATYI